MANGEIAPSTLAHIESILDPVTSEPPRVIAQRVDGVCRGSVKHALLTLLAQGRVTREGPFGPWHEMRYRRVERVA